MKECCRRRRTVYRNHPARHLQENGEDNVTNCVFCDVFSWRGGAPVTNSMRVRRIMGNDAMLQEKHTTARKGCIHDGKVR